MIYSMITDKLTWKLYINIKYIYTYINKHEYQKSIPKIYNLSSNIWYYVFINYN